MVNRIRGEAALEAGGKSYRLLLTLGALAEIEHGLGLANLMEVSKRLAQTRAADLAVVAAALLRGGGHEITADEVLRLPCDLGALVQAVTEAFDTAATGGGGEARPFAGAT
jgi:hypothetical protein